MAQPEPYISHLNESALQVLNLGGAVNSDELRGDVSPLKVLKSFPAVKVPQATRRRVETIQSRYTATEGKSPEIFLENEDRKYGSTDYDNCPGGRHDLGPSWIFLCANQSGK